MNRSELIHFNLLAIPLTNIKILKFCLIFLQTLIVLTKIHSFAVVVFEPVVLIVV